MNNSFDQEVENFFKNYHDRGMKKWAGFFLSDHTVQINKTAAIKVNKKKAEMSQFEISKTLWQAFCNHQEVKLQLKDLDENGNLAEDIIGFVDGYDGQNQVIISGYPVFIDTINNVALS